MKQRNNQPVDAWKTNNLLSRSALEEGGGQKGEVWLLLLILRLILWPSNHGNRKGGGDGGCRVKHASIQQSNREGATNKQSTCLSGPTLKDEDKEK